MLEDASIRPYFIRAVYEWCVDQGCTPYLLANWCESNRKIPPQLVNNGKIVFNVSDEAVRRFMVNDDGVSFTARFLGRTVEVHVPIADVLSIYARERQSGISFPPLPEQQGETPVKKQTADEKSASASPRRGTSADAAMGGKSGGSGRKKGDNIKII